MKICLPRDWSFLTATIQECLLLAKNNGFDIEDIFLDIGRDDHLVILSDQKALRITTDLFERLGNEDTVDISIYYRCQTQERNQHDVDSNRSVYINIEGQGGYFDVFSLNNVQKTLCHRRCLTDKQIHFCWFVTLMALDFSLEDSLAVARAMDNVSRETWPTCVDDFPTPVINAPFALGDTQVRNDDRFPVIQTDKLGLYPVVDSVEWVKRCLDLGVKTVQLRIKGIPENLERCIVEAVLLGQKYSAQVFINDHWQLAIKHGAYGVHLGQQDLNDADITKIKRAGLRLGISTHGYFEMLNAFRVGPSYLALGHIFPTTTKEMPSKPQGLVRLRLYQRLMDSTYQSGLTEAQQGPIPTVAIGGIDLENASQVWACGVNSLAVVRAITQSKDPKWVVSQFNSIIALGEVDLCEDCHA